MNISPWTLYWFTRLDSIGYFFGFFTVIFAIATTIVVFMYLVSDDEYVCAGPIS